MSVVLDPVRRAGPAATAALCRVVARGRSAGGAIVFHAKKAPLAILWRAGGTMGAVEPGGAALTEAEIEALAPGAWARFAAETS